MLVDRAIAGHVERLLRDLPAKAPAEHDVRLEPTQERREDFLVAGHDQVDALRRRLVGRLAPGRRRHIDGVRPPLHQPRDDVVTHPAHRLDHRLHDRQHVRDHDHAPPLRLPGHRSIIRPLVRSHSRP